jgi:hypothetical protein
MALAGVELTARDRLTDFAARCVIARLTDFVTAAADAACALPLPAPPGRS